MSNHLKIVDNPYCSTNLFIGELIICSNIM